MADIYFLGGFYSVPPDLPLSKVRREINQQIGMSNVVPRNFVFIKSVGRCFTQVSDLSF